MSMGNIAGDLFAGESNLWRVSRIVRSSKSAAVVVVCVCICIRQWHQPFHAAGVVHRCTSYGPGPRASAHETERVIKSGRSCRGFQPEGNCLALLSHCIMKCSFCQVQVTEWKRVRVTSQETYIRLKLTYRVEPARGPELYTCIPFGD
jgi:hypothetical protein